MTDIVIEEGSQSLPSTPTVASVSAGDFFKYALMEIRVLGVGQGIKDEIAEICMEFFNRLIGNNNIIKSSIWTIRQDLFTLTAGKQDYTWGVDPDGESVADIALARPTFIENIVLRYDSGNVFSPMTKLNQLQWASIPIKTTSSYPNSFYNDGAYPLTNIHFYPNPSAAYVVELWTGQKGAAITSLADKISYPDGYTSYLHYNLAKALCGPFAKAFNADQNLNWQLANSRIAAINSKPPDLIQDSICNPRGRRYDWRTGQ
jgi:hypothetical protein